MNFTIFLQSLKQMWGIIAIEYKYQGKLPNIENYQSKVKYSLPFEGKWYVANGGITQETSHSWEVPTQRYAYDFIKLDIDGNSFCGNETEAEAFYCYGQNILAPADGTVVEVLTGKPNSKITPSRAATCAANDIRGNYLLICHADNEYSLLAHLKPDSILVSEGQFVRRGEKIAQCGNSGNTSEPHLHFHLQAGKSFYSSAGLPVRFENIKIEKSPHDELLASSSISELEEKLSPYCISRGYMVCNK